MPRHPAKPTRSPAATPAADPAAFDSGRGDVYVSLSVAELVRRNLVYWIRERGYATDEKFAHEKNIPKSTLSQVKNKTRIPRVDTLENLAKALELPLYALFKVPEPRPADWDTL